MGNDSEKVIAILGFDDTRAVEKGYGDRLQSNEININNLKEKLADFAEKLDDIFSVIKPNYDDYDLDEIEAKIEISASGEIRLIGKIEAGASGGLTLKYKRNKHEL